MDFNLLNENTFWIVPLVVAITEVFKMSGFNTKFAPMISLVVGIAMSFLINIEGGLSQSIISGIIYGLTGSGLYSSVKTTSNIRGVVPLRTNKEAVTVEHIEIEKPLNESTVTASEEIKVTENMETATNNQTTPIMPKPVENIDSIAKLNVSFMDEDKNRP